MSKDIIEIKLNDELEYDYKGDKKAAKFVSLRKPTAKNVHLTCIIKNAFQAGASAISDRIESDGASAPQASVESEDDSLNISGPDAVALLYNAPEGLEKCMLSFKELLRDVCEFDGDQRATVPLIDNLSVEDFEAILGEYLVNFILASLLQNQKKKLDS